MMVYTQYIYTEGVKGIKTKKGGGDQNIREQTFKPLYTFPNIRHAPNLQDKQAVVTDDDKQCCNL